MTRYGATSHGPWCDFWDFWSEYIAWTGGFTLCPRRQPRVRFRVIALAAPPLLLAVCGGMTAAALGVRVVRQSVPKGRLRVIPARSAMAAFVAAAVLLALLVWAAQVRGRWLLYRVLADWAVQDEIVARQQYEWAAHADQVSGREPTRDEA